MSLDQKFNDYHSRMNDIILVKENIVLKRFFSLDNQVFKGGALSEKPKELPLLVASMVFQFDDCIKYHLGTCHEPDVIPI